MLSHTGSSQQDQSTLYQAALTGLSMLPNPLQKKPLKVGGGVLEKVSVGNEDLGVDIVYKYVIVNK